MALDVDVPKPPDLTMQGTPSDFRSSEDAGGSEDFRREEIEDMLQDGAWRSGFEEWTEYTDLGEEEIGAIDDLGLFQSLDFYWNPDDEMLQYDVPEVPDDWRERAPESMASTSGESRIETELDDLGRTVLEELQDTYLDWSDELSDNVWGEEAFGERGEQE